MTTIFLLLLLTGTQITMAEDWIATVTAKIKGPTVDQLWPYLADFCNCYRIYPSDVSFCVQGTEGKPGLTRYIVYKTPSPADPNTTIVKWVAEELLEIDATQKYVTHIMHQNNKGISKFSATVQLLPTGDNGCIFKWSVVAAPIDGLTYKEFVGKLEETVSGVV